jgi:hypothetical protein
MSWRDIVKLKGKQKNLDKNHNGVIDAQDFHIMNGETKKGFEITNLSPPSRKQKIREESYKNTLRDFKQQYEEVSKVLEISDIGFNLPLSGHFITLSDSEKLLQKFIDTSTKLKRLHIDIRTSKKTKTSLIDRAKQANKEDPRMGSGR